MDSDIDEQAARQELSERLAKMMDETTLPTDDDEYDYDTYDDDEDDDDDDEACERPAERWAPLGAAATTPPTTGPHTESRHMSESERLNSLEQEQEQLNSSLLALTTHFAQVQFRLKQVTAAAPEEKEFLLKELEEFAFKGIPDVRGCAEITTQSITAEEVSEKEHDAKLAEKRQKQQELIQQLKSQLEDLENYAYQTGNSELPTNVVIEKQSAVIDQLRAKLDLKLDEFDHLTPEDLRTAVDQAIGRIVNPAKVKEKLVDQLKTQITDLERFIDFLQGEAQDPGPLGSVYNQPKCKHCDKDKKRKKGKKAAHGDIDNKTLRAQTIHMMKQALAVLQLFAVSQFGCGGREFQKNILKRTTKANHWGDLRARLEVSVDHVIHLQHEAVTNQPDDTDYASDCDDAPVIRCNQELTTAVRKELAMALKELLQHGLMEVGQGQSMVAFGCFPSRSQQQQQATTMMHAWDLFVKYYEMKHGREYNETPARKLSQSFGLDMVGGKAITAKQTLLSAIEEVRSKHVPLKRSEDSQFKAFVCLGLNQRRLVLWLRLVLRTPSLIEYYYQPWSYVIRTGCDDTLVSLERLTKLEFSLPVDLAIRPFSNIKDAF